MRVSLIVAMDEQRGIGFQGGIPWHLPDDLKQFKALTMGHHLVMGRKTYESIGKPLPGRTTILLTRDPHYSPQGVLTAHSLDEALELAHSRGESELFIIGGGEIFSQALNRAHRLYLTQVHACLPADTYFPKWEETSWIETSSTFHPADDRHPIPFSLKIYERRTPDQ